MVTLIECRQSLLARLLHVMELMRLLWLEMPWRNELTLGWPPVWGLISDSNILDLMGALSNHLALSLHVDIFHYKSSPPLRRDTPLRSLLCVGMHHHGRPA